MELSKMQLVHREINENFLTDPRESAKLSYYKSTSELYTSGEICTKTIDKSFSKKSQEFPTSSNL